MMKHDNSTEAKTMTQFTKGQKVRTIWGMVVTVLEQVGNTVYVYEGPLDWYHVTKVFAIEN